MKNHTSTKKLISILVLIGVTVLVLWPALQGGFFFDDEPNIVQNKAIQIDSLDIQSLYSSVINTQAAGPMGRPISVLSFALTYWFFGMDPYFFKLINLGIHIINGILIYSLIINFSYLRSKSNQSTVVDGQNSFALFCALVWLIHPINILPVMLVAQRMALLATLFILCGLKLQCLAYQNSKNKILFPLLMLSYFVCWPLSFFSKETGVLFPFYASIYFLVVYFFEGSKKSKFFLKLNLYISFGLLALGSVILLHYRDALSLLYSTRSFDMSERLLTQLRVLWFYWFQIVIPNYSSYGIYLDDFLISKSVINPISTVASLCGWVLVVGVTCVWGRKKIALLLLFGWFLVGHLLESSFLPLEIAHEYRNYLPSVGVVVGVSLLANSLLRHFLPSKAVLAMCSLVVLLYGFLTWQRAIELGNPLVGLQLEANRHPLSARAHYTAAQSLFQNGIGHATQDAKMGEVVAYHFEEAGRVDPSFKLGYLGLITWACSSQIPIEPRWIEQLSQRLKQTNFIPGDNGLPTQIGQLLSLNRDCLTHQQIVLLLESGGQNDRAFPAVRSEFWEVLGDYESMIRHNNSSAAQYYKKGLDVYRYNRSITPKLKVVSGDR